MSDVVEYKSEENRAIGGQRQNEARIEGVYGSRTAHSLYLLLHDQLVGCWIEQGKHSSSVITQPCDCIMLIPFINFLHARKLIIGLAGTVSRPAFIQATQLPGGRG